MTLANFVASQLRKPSGFFGRIVTSRVLNQVNRPMNELTLKLLDLEPEDQVLEVGFGGGDLIGRMTAMVGRGRIVGVDFSPEMVEVCAKRFAPLIQSKKVELHCANAENIPQAAESFTKACTVNTIYFWPDPVVALREIRRTMRSGGCLVVCFNPKATVQNQRFVQYGFTLYDPEEVQQLMEKAGFRETRMVAGSHRLGEFKCAVATK